jgi:hypothetical protein
MEEAKEWIPGATKHEVVTAYEKLPIQIVRAQRGPDAAPHS